MNTKTKESLEFGKLTKGRKLTKAVADDSPTSSPESWTIAGHSAAKVDGRAFVTGKHQYASDIRLPGMWYGKVLRPPSFGATLASVDLEPRPRPCPTSSSSTTAISSASPRPASPRPSARWPRSRRSGSPVRRSPARTSSTT